MVKVPSVSFSHRRDYVSIPNYADVNAAFSASSDPHVPAYQDRSFLEGSGNEISGGVDSTLTVG